MWNSIRAFGIAAILLLSAAHAQEIAGNWQGTLKVGPQELRLIVQVTKGDNGSWKATMYSIDQTTDPIPIDSVTLADSDLKLSAAALRWAYEGKISADGNNISGTATQLGQSLPLDLRRPTKETAWPIDPSDHQIQFITVDKDVKLEVLDWGGSGRPLVLLAGLGNNAHVFDKFAPKLIASYHVYGITRRGFGASSHPETGYSADRLGDDVLAVIDALKLNRPVLVGHSLGGEELSSVGSRHPEKVSGLIYLDAGYSYAYYDRSKGDMTADLAELRRKLDRLAAGAGATPQELKPLVQQLLETDLPAFEKDLKESQKQLESAPAGPAPPPAPRQPIVEAIMAGVERYTDIHVPILAIFAVPHAHPPVPGQDAAAVAAADARDEEITGAQAKAFETGLPSAHVVRLPHADHYVFRSNEADVLREMNAFLSSLPK